MSTTTVQDVTATWGYDVHGLRVHSVSDPARDDVALGGSCDLKEASARLPEYAGLWTAIDKRDRALRHEWAPFGPVGQQHAAFFHMPY